MLRAKRVSSDIGRGNSTIRFPRRTPLTMIVAARSALIRNGILNSFFSVIAVAMKPGFTVVTRIENFATSIGLNAKDGSGWDTLEAAAQDPTLEEVPDHKGVMCSPAVPTFDEKAFEELTKETRTEIDEWGYPAMADVEVHQGPRPNSPVIDKLGMVLVRVMDSEEAQGNPNGPPPPMKVVTPSGKVGYVPSDAIMPIAFDQLCYMKDGGSWKITGYAGGGD